MAAKKERESKADKFVRLARERMPKVIARLRSIRNLAHPVNYDHSKDQAERIVKSLEIEIEAIRKAFANPESAKIESGWDF